MVDRDQLRAAIAAQESLRGTLPDEVVDVAVAALQSQLATLEEAPKAPPKARRGQATVLFADVAGFTALSEDMDPEVIAGLMNELWEVVDAAIERHGGRVDKHIGDAVMGVWGAGTVKEDDPERAVRAALELRTAFEGFRSRNDLPINVRVGVNTGPVLFGDIGTGGERSVTGDAVNVASRVEGVAPKGGVLLSHDTYRLVRGVFDVHPQDPVSVKGKAEPLRTYVVDREKPRAFRLRTHGVEGVETRMVGRESELALLQQAFEESIGERCARAVTVVGEAGGGKSRLLDEFVAWLDLHPERILYLKGRSVPDHHVPRGLLRELFSYRFEILEDDPRADVAAKLHAGFQTLEPTEASLTGLWLGFELGPEDADHPLAGSPDFGAIAESLLIRFLRTLLTERPAVMVLEDIHWADRDSLDTVVRIVEQLSNQPLLVVAVARPSLDVQHPEWGDGPGDAVRLDLTALSDADPRRLVELILDRVTSLPPSLVELVVDHADGNPFYVEELIKTLVDERVIVVSATEPWTVAVSRLRGLAVPPTLAGVLQARLDALPGDERSTVQQASVVGRTFWDSAVAALLATDTTDIDVDDALDGVCHRELVYRNDRSVFSGSEEYRFKHALLRDAAYETVLLRDRRRLHAAAADWMEQRSVDRYEEHVALIAEHLALAEEPARAAPLFGRAAAKAAATGAVAAATSLYDRALRCYELVDLGHGAEATQIRIDLGLNLDRAGADAIAVEQLRVAAADATALGDRELEALAGAHLARLALVAGDWEEAHRLLEATTPLAEEAGGKVLAEVLLGRAWHLEVVDDPRRSLAPARRALELSHAADDPELELRALNQLSISAARVDDLDGAAAQVELALGLARRIGNHQREAVLLNTQGALAHLRSEMDGTGDLGPAIDLYRRSADLSEELGFEVGLTDARINLAQAEIEAGQLDEGAAHARSCLELAWRRGRYPDAGFAVLVLAQATIAEGDERRGLEIMASVLHDPRTDDQTDEVARILGTLGLDEVAAEKIFARESSASLEDLVPTLLAAGGGA